MARILTISEFDRVSPSRAIDKPAVAFLPATAGDLASIGACAGKIADWSIAGRIGEGQPVPRFGSVARSPLTGRGSDGRPGLIRNPLFVLPLRDNPRGEVSGEFGGRLAVRLRVAGTAIRCDVLGAPPARGVLGKLKLVFRRVFHALKHGVERRECGPRKLSIRSTK